MQNKNKIRLTIGSVLKFWNVPRRHFYIVKSFLKNRLANLCVLHLTLVMILALLFVASGYAKDEELLQPGGGVKDSTELVSLYFDNTDIRDVTEILAEKAGMNMIVSQKAQAKVTLKLDNVTWQSALDLILRTYNLTYKKDENLIRVMTFQEVEEEEKKIPMDTKIIILSFADAETITGSINNMLSSRGSIQLNNRTNSLIFTDVPDRLKKIEETVNELDSPTPQVLIEALILDVKITDEDEFGIDWRLLHQETPTKSVDLQASSSVFRTSFTAFKVALAKKLGAYDWTTTITSWVQNRKAKVLASPRLLTLDNMEASIAITSQVPYTEMRGSTDGGSTTGISYKDIGTKLYVTAHVTEDGHISMRLRPAQEV